MIGLANWYPAAIAYRRWNEFVTAWRYHALVKTHRLPIWPATPLQRLSNELVFADLLRQLRDAHPWIPAPLYTVGGAASHGLIYSLVRSLTEHRFTKVLELGVGQTTKVLSAYSTVTGARVVSLEENADWAAKLRDQHGSPSHTILHAPLTRTAGGSSWYDSAVWRDHVPSGGFDLLVIDGPVGTHGLSRAGIVEFFAELHGAEWAVIWDDLDRLADLRAFVVFRESLRGANEPSNEAFCSGTKLVGFAFTEQYAALGHYC